MSEQKRDDHGRYAPASEFLAWFVQQFPGEHGTGERRDAACKAWCAARQPFIERNHELLNAGAERDARIRELEATCAAMTAALSAIAEATKEPSGGSYWPLRSLADSMAGYTDDLDGERLIPLVARNVVGSVGLAPWRVLIEVVRKFSRPRELVEPVEAWNIQDLVKELCDAAAACGLTGDGK